LFNTQSNMFRRLAQCPPSAVTQALRRSRCWRLLCFSTGQRASTSRTRHRGTAAKGDAWLYPAWFVATESDRTHPT